MTPVGRKQHINSIAQQSRCLPTSHKTGWSCHTPEILARGRQRHLLIHRKFKTSPGYMRHYRGMGVSCKGADFYTALLYVSIMGGKERTPQAYIRRLKAMAGIQNW